MRLRVAIESTALLGSRSGIGEFTYSLLASLPDKNWQVDAFAISWRRRAQLVDLLPEGVGRINRPLPARPLHVMWRHSEFPPIDLLLGHYDLIHGANFVVPPTRKSARVLTVHDLTPVRFPQLCHPSVLVFPTLVQRAIDRGAFVHTPTEAVRGEVIEVFGADEDRVVAIHHGMSATTRVDDPVGSIPPRLFGEVVPGRQMVLAVGTIEPRKDYPMLLRAFDELVGGGVDAYLVIAGARGWGADEFDRVLARMSNRDKVVTLGWVSEQERQWLYSNANVFVYPSIYEGFGLPPLEAMAHQLPVVVTAVDAVQEVVGDACMVVAVGDSSALADAMRAVLLDAELAHALGLRGLERTREFSWERSARAFHELYRRAIGERHGKS